MHHAPVDVEGRGDRDECELIRCSITYLEIAGTPRIPAVRDMDLNDQLTRFQRVLEMGSISR
jgi:hypothetical protein